MYCRIFGKIPSLYPLDGISCSQVWESKVSPDIAKCPLGDKIGLASEPL